MGSSPIGVAAMEFATWPWITEVCHYVGRLKWCWSVGVAVISFAFHAKDHGFDPRTDYDRRSMNNVFVNYFNDDEVFKIVPLTMQRDWMHESKEKFAYKCLPLNIANQYGWTVLSPCDFNVAWYGGASQVDVEVFDIEEKYAGSITSHFGTQTFTILPDFIIQTPPGFSSYIRGVPNRSYGVLKPLDAIVETDWLPFTFTYNYKFEEPGIVKFKKGDPLFSFFPIERNTVENFSLVTRKIDEGSEFYQDFKEYANSRDDFNSHERDSRLFQRFYIDGKGPNKFYEIKNHIKKLFFKESTPESVVTEDLVPKKSKRKE